jgi:hypothetical protein
MVARTRILYPSVDYVVDGETSPLVPAYSTQRWQKDLGSSMVALEIDSGEDIAKEDHGALRLSDALH